MQAKKDARGHDVDGGKLPKSCRVLRAVWECQIRITPTVARKSSASDEDRPSSNASRTNMFVMGTSLRSAASRYSDSNLLCPAGITPSPGLPLRYPSRLGSVTSHHD